MKLNWPNRLSLWRLILAFVVMALVITSFYGEVRARHDWGVTSGVYHLSYLMMSAGIIFVIASVTDFLDGYIARKYQQITTFGKFIDPIADKFLVNSVLIMFGVIQILPIWMVVILILRDIMVDFLRMILASGGVTLSAGIYGKLKTVFQMIGLTLLFFASYANFKPGTIYADEYKWMNQVVMIPMYLATFFSLFSAGVYFKQAKPALLETK